MHAELASAQGALLPWGTVPSVVSLPGIIFLQAHSPGPAPLPDSCLSSKFTLSERPFPDCDRGCGCPARSSSAGSVGSNGHGLLCPESCCWLMEVMS